jgi:hypothetical protein
MATRRRPSSRGRRPAPPPQNTNTQQYLIVFGGVGLLLLVIILMVVSSGSDKKKQPVDATTKPAAEKPPETKKKPEVPAEVPSDFKTKVELAWPSIEKNGKEFENHYKAAQDAKRIDDRPKFMEETDKAAKAIQRMGDEWAAVYYSVDDLPQNVQEVCRRWLASYDKKVSRWTKKAKALKELSIAATGN